ncbi:MAG: hypothetical protein HYZ33_04335, partial [Ignavibacteriales bacterium]|nr:hypothetical protein [Ignavibacteriales bacterium]
MKFFFISLCLFVLCFSCDVCSQEDDFIITRLGRGQQTLFSRVNDITQDRIGFIWLATDNGLFRYDGYSMKAFPLAKDLVSESNRQVVQVAIDSSGMLWSIGKEIVRLHPLTGETQNFQLSSAQHNDAWNFRIFLDRDGGIWLLADSLYRFNEGQLRFVSYPIPLQGTSLKKGFIHSVQKFDILWLASSMSAIYRLNKRTGSFEAFQSEDDSLNKLEENFTTGLFEDRSGRIWLGKYSQLYLFNNESKKFLKVYNNGSNGVFFENSNRKLFVGYGSNF